MTQPTLLHTLQVQRFTTLKRLCVHMVEQSKADCPEGRGRSFTQVYLQTRRELAQLVVAGTITCWSKGKPLYVLTDEAEQLRTDLRLAMLERIIRCGDITPRTMRSVPLCGLTVAMDLQQELAAELMADGLIENVGQRGAGRMKVYRATEEARVRFADPVTVTTPVVAETLAYLMTPTKVGFRRDSALNIAERLKRPLLEVKRAIMHLMELGMVRITAEVGALKVYGYALTDLVSQRVERLPAGAPVLADKPTEDLRSEEVAGVRAVRAQGVPSATVRLSAALRAALTVSGVQVPAGRAVRSAPRASRVPRRAVGLLGPAARSGAWRAPSFPSGRLRMARAPGEVRSLPFGARWRGGSSPPGAAPDATRTWMGMQRPRGRRVSAMSDIFGDPPLPATRRGRGGRAAALSAGRSRIGRIPQGAVGQDRGPTCSGEHRRLRASGGPAGSAGGGRRVPARRSWCALHRRAGHHHDRLATGDLPGRSHAAAPRRGRVARGPGVSGRAPRAGARRQARPGGGRRRGARASPSSRPPASFRWA